MAKQYEVRPLKVDEELVKAVTERRSAGESIGKISAALGVGLGNAAMAEFVGTVERRELKDPAALARVRWSPKPGTSEEAPRLLHDRRRKRRQRGATRGCRAP